MGQEDVKEYRVAILPMTNFTAKAFLSEGITDDVLVGLSKMEGIKMIARQSTTGYKNSSKTLSKIGGELGVKYLLKGSLKPIAHQYKVDVSFLEATTGEVLWAESFTKDTAEVFAFQQMITQGIANRLTQYFDLPYPSPLPTIATQNAAAYNAYLAGRASFYKAGPEGMRKAIDYFKRALDLDPDFNLARAWLAWSYCSSAGSWGDQTASEVYGFVQEELSKIEDDKTLESMRLKILGWMHFWMLDRNQAENYLRKAVAINPNEEFGLSALGMVLTLKRNFKEATVIAKQGLDLNPHFFWNHFVLGQNQYYQGQLEEALASINHGLALFDQHQASVGIKSRILSLTGHSDQAIDYLKSFLANQQVPPSSPYADLGLAYVYIGETDQAQKIAKDLLDRHKRGEKYTAYFAAKIFAALGKHDKAMDLLEDAFQKRDNELNWVEVDLEFKPLYQMPRFQTLISKLAGPY